MLAARGALAGPATGHGDSVLQLRPELMEETQRWSWVLSSGEAGGPQAGARSSLPAFYSGPQCHLTFLATPQVGNAAPFKDEEMVPVETFVSGPPSACGLLLPLARWSWPWAALLGSPGARPWRSPGG